MSGCHSPTCLNTCCEEIKRKLNDLYESYRGLFHEYDHLKEEIDSLKLRIKELERYQDIANEQYKVIVHNLEWK